MVQQHTGLAIQNAGQLMHTRHCRMEWTDVHYRQMARMVSKHVWLWTEMVVDKTIIYTDNLDRHLWFPPEQHPIVLQVGGSDPETLRKAALKIAPYGYDEVNLNCGCPSDRVAGAGCFGASMMLRPDNVAACMQVRMRCSPLRSGFDCIHDVCIGKACEPGTVSAAKGRWRNGSLCVCGAAYCACDCVRPCTLTRQQQQSMHAHASPSRIDPFLRCSVTDQYTV